MRSRFPAARWPRSLQVISAVGTTVIVVVAIAATRVIPVGSGFTHSFGVGVAALSVALLLGCALLVVTDYEVEGATLYVGRLVWYTRVPLDGLNSAWLDPDACRGAARMFGNGGLYSFTGVYYSSRLGRFRLFATDLSHAVVLTLADRILVVTPADPQALIEHLRHRFPKLAAHAPNRA